MRVMKWHVVTLAALLVMSGVTWAQETDKAEEAAVEGTQQAPGERLKNLEKEYMAGYNALGVKFRAAKDRAGQQAIMEELSVLQKKIGEQIAELMEETKGTPDAMAAYSLLFKTTRSVDPATIAKIKANLLSDHVNDDGFAPMLAQFASDKEFMAKVKEKSTNKTVKGASLFFEMSALKGRGLTEANADKVLPLMKTIAAEYGDVSFKFPNGRSSGKLGAIVENEIFAYENLRVGKVAPNIEGEDIDGVKFQLSDYRGKVVVLDFWGDW